MPADLSKKAMTEYIKNSLISFGTIRGMDNKAMKSNELFTYILTYFNHFINNFRENLNFLNVVRKKCVEYINTDDVMRYESLLKTCFSLLEKMNEEIRKIENEESNKCACEDCYIKNNYNNHHIQKAHAVGLIG